MVQSINLALKGDTKWDDLSTLLTNLENSYTVTVQTNGPQIVLSLVEIESP